MIGEIVWSQGGQGREEGWGGELRVYCCLTNYTLVTWDNFGIGGTAFIQVTGSQRLCKGWFKDFQKTFLKILNLILTHIPAIGFHLHDVSYDTSYEQASPINKFSQVLR